jgi:hypothetical protein
MIITILIVTSHSNQRCAIYSDRFKAGVLLAASGLRKFKRSFITV